MSVEQMSTSFAPEKHGFRFVNNFAIEKSEFGLGAGKLHFGLCGGMCLAALRRYRQETPVPPAAVPPAPGAALFRELFLCQTETLLPTIWGRFLRWQVRPDKPFLSGRYNIGFSTREQWRRKLRPRLNNGEPAILGLVRAKGVDDDPSQNHQVLAIGYRWDAGAEDLTLALYDPNYPGRVVDLKMNFSRPAEGIHAVQSTGESCRGFFVISEK